MKGNDVNKKVRAAECMTFLNDYQTSVSNVTILAS